MEGTEEGSARLVIAGNAGGRKIRGSSGVIELEGEKWEFWHN